MQPWKSGCENNDDGGDIYWYKETMGNYQPVLTDGIIAIIV